MALVKGIRGNGIGVVDITSDGSVIEVLLKVIIEEVGIINHVANMAEVGIVWHGQVCLLTFTLTSDKARIVPNTGGCQDVQDGDNINGDKSWRCNIR